jgi:hypothetical protein
MRPTPWLLAEPHRLQVPGYESAYGDNYGMFLIPHARTGVKLRVMAQSGSNSRADLGHAYAWDHVSVSLPNRTPNWTEMAFVKSIFWDDHETVMQLHVPVAEHRNLHPNCLHLWRPLNERIPQPPPDMVA